MGDGQDDRLAFIRREMPAMLLLAKQLSQSLEDAEDAVQDGFVRFWRSRRNVKQYRPYLYACVRSAAIDIGRKRASQGGLTQDLASAARPGVDWFKMVGDREWARRVQTALSALPLEQREVVVLKLWVDLTFEQIARVQGVALNTAASRYRYAMSRLRELLGEEGEYGR
jgi:RNA polymerase sigma-70 factor, ECF subfamily